jgi:Rrf2 family protein
MKLSARARYAVRLIVEVERRGGAAAPVRLSEVAKVTGIPRSFLEQLALALRNRGLLRAVAGRHGGYSLARRAADISIRDVVTAVSGPISVAVCAEDADVCMYAEDCECRVLWCVLQKRINALLEEYSVADLTSEEAVEGIRKEVEPADMVCRVRGQGANPGGLLGVGPLGCARPRSGGPLS